jgi:hypothetical protein
MARWKWMLGLLICVVAVAGVWTRLQSPCARPIALRLGEIDDKFGLTRDETLEALRHAEELWERALGRTLFAHRATATVTVRLIYDERQQTTQARERLENSLRETRASHDAVGRSYAHVRMTYDGRARDFEARHAEYEERARAYNAQVQQWNARGGAPPEAQADLEAERGRLETMRRQLENDRAALEDFGASVKSLAEKGNAIAADHNRTATTFNAAYGAPREFHKGEFDGREITVFEFHDIQDLTLVFAHELGHALGIGHVQDPAAIMHAVGGEQVVDPLSLAPADVAALKAVCRLR